ncbi:MAG: 2-oxo acid dehydrogenase subunit E2, partial [Leeuwenhoekiella sp.]|nr:2-oxo acid dehydrogenase subunit E2 [Leeuwenhoekiella sp.]
MAEVIKMPRLSDTMEEGTVASWLKKVGDKVEEGDILAEIETDKATMEFESFYEGTLLHIGIQEGETANVDALLAIIGEEGEDISGLIDGSSDSESASKSDSKEQNADDSKEEEETQEDSSDDAEEEESSDNAESSDIPEGVEVISMPRLSDTMEEGTVASWLKKVGDKVEEGDILAEIETDKATMEFESFYKGTLLHIGIQEGETAKVDALLAIIGEEGTDVSGLINGNKSGSAKKETSKKEAPKKEAPKQEAPKQEGSKKEAPKKEESKKEASKPQNSSSADGRVFASPLAKKLAEEKGVDISKVSGSGENGRVVRKDVENYSPAATGASVQQFVATGEESYEDVSNSQMRKAIAKSLGKSKFTAPHYYLNVEFNMENMIAFRSQFNQLPDTKVSYNDMIIKAVSIALKQHPQVNSQWFDDKMRLNKHVHIGVAVAV